MNQKEVVEQYIKRFKLLSVINANAYTICPFKDDCDGHGSCKIKGRKLACLNESDQSKFIARLIKEGYEKYKKEEN